MVALIRLFEYGNRPQDSTAEAEKHLLLWYDSHWISHPKRTCVKTEGNLSLPNGKLCFHTGTRNIPVNWCVKAIRVMRGHTFKISISFFIPIKIGFCIQYCRPEAFLHAIFSLSNGCIKDRVPSPVRTTKFWSDFSPDKRCKPLSHIKTGKSSPTLLFRKLTEEWKKPSLGNLTHRVASHFMSMFTDSVFYLWCV